MSTTSIVEIGRFEISRNQAARWRSGELSREWAKQFPQLFDSDDLALASTQGPMGYHFVEWLGAIKLLELTGCLSLVSKYEFPKHRRKKDILSRLLAEPVLALIQDHTRFGRTQCPDLLAYSPDYADWFFCEVKGPGDRLSGRQRLYFEELARVSAKPIRLLRFKWGHG
jgi:hypothetical protein